MTGSLAFIHRFFAGAALALGVLATAALSGAIAGADPPPGSLGSPSLCGMSGCMAPPISPVEAKAAGTYALVSFTTIEPAVVTVDYKPAMTAAPAAGGSSPAQSYATTHERTLTGLTSNTTYDMTVTATTQSGQKHTAKTSFTTAKKRVVVTLESIDIKDDGDLIGNGEPVWHVKPYWDGRSITTPYWDGSYCYPNVPGTSTAPHRCKPGSYGEGRITPRNSTGQAMMIIFAEEHFDPGTFPRKVSLQVWAKEDDAIGGAQIIECVTGGCPVGDDASVREWRVPQGVESAEQRITVPAVDASTGFESTMTFRFELVHHNVPYPMQNPNAPINTWDK